MKYYSDILNKFRFAWANIIKLSNILKELMPVSQCLLFITSLPPSGRLLTVLALSQFYKNFSLWFLDPEVRVECNNATGSDFLCSLPAMERLTSFGRGLFKMIVSSEGLLHQLWDSGGNLLYFNTLRENWCPVTIKSPCPVGASPHTKGAVRIHCTSKVSK